VLAIVGSSLWIYFVRFAAPNFNVPLHRAVGRVMAEETAKLLNNRGKIVVIAIDGPELRVQLEEFEQTLKQSPAIEIDETYIVDTENKPKYGPGSGLSGARFARIVNKNLKAAAIVSFIGAPELSEEEIGQLQARPKFIAQSRSVEKLPPLFEKQLLHVAIVRRFQFPAPIEGRPATLRQWFDKQFQIVTAGAGPGLPPGGGD
jgi:hypothetical protein